MSTKTVGVLHYSAPPVIGGVEAVLKAHVSEFLRAGYAVRVTSSISVNQLGIAGLFLHCQP
jgi:hypothetical protein